MAEYNVRVTYPIDHEDPKSAAEEVSMWLMEGVIFRPAVDVFDADGNCVYSSDPMMVPHADEEERE